MEALEARLAPGATDEVTVSLAAVARHLDEDFFHCRDRDTKLLDAQCAARTSASVKESGRRVLGSDRFASAAKTSRASGDSAGLGATPRIRSETCP